jgi:hypothetical protein
MDSMDMSSSMGNMSMGNGVPGLFYMQQMYWKFVGSAIAFAFVVNIFNKTLAVERYIHTHLISFSAIRAHHRTGYIQMAQPSPRILCWYVARLQRQPFEKSPTPPLLPYPSGESTSTFLPLAV